MTTANVTPQNRTRSETVAYGTQVSVQIDAVWCDCGVPYGLSRRFIEARREDHATFYCPNGCSRWFPPGSSTLEKKAAKLEEEKQRLERQLELTTKDRERQRNGRLLAERQRAAAKGQVTKIKNRVAAGVCPCCNRTFQNLARHIAGQHPNFAGGQD